MKKVAIIGAGIAGISTAIRLAHKGFEVAVFEANTYAGGKLSSFEREGYRFDAGPSLFTLPHLVDELFELTGKNPNQYFDYVKLPDICHYFWEDDTKLTAWAETERFAKEVEQITGESAQKILDFLKDSAFKYEVLDGLFLQDSLHKLSTWTSLKALKGYLNLPKLGIFGTMNEANEKLFKNPKIVQLFNRYATYNGSDPYQTPATLNIIPHLEYNIGAFFPKKGMVSITDSLVKLAEDLGVTFNYESKVEEILVTNKKASGIRFSNSLQQHIEKDVDIVVSNMDVTHTYRKLMPTQQHPERLLNQPKSSSGVIFYWGIKQQFAELGLHNIFFSDDYRKEFQTMFNDKTITSDPTVYINITSKLKKDDAPAGCENWFVLINAPANEGQDWDKIIADTRQNVIKKVSRILKVDISDLIVCEEILDPRTIESKTSSAQGALYGNSSNNRYAAFLRHANFSSKIQNLYFVGGSVHPGGGIPLAISSAKIACKYIDA
ncbi:MULTISPECIES: 1-hydroxycarotenoid 3,4-desaturase CrtD [unclassified Arcicella]|uniref:1-hydroxycarotenoid 3,4-desaturase CrtD n=1 Tax=unclassified Arcicella TaxID=2644986 RepID=UPI00285DB1D2|nr:MULTISPECIES: 1-hydroxycarotenoid 3,4-desaturase CrtD [unclassified Arcicella]MDR6563294.1 phytoene desaturase [Arcicella sp. BE51]MDR6813285.1 phytoene desaturase [Arcicella sp. BE140]MDR6824599.1 phytoene desaturase [Arcicella sp. BE139]